MKYFSTSLRPPGPPSVSYGQPWHSLMLHQSGQKSNARDWTREPAESGKDEERSTEGKGLQLGRMKQAPRPRLPFSETLQLFLSWWPWSASHHLGTGRGLSVTNETRWLPHRLVSSWPTTETDICSLSPSGSPKLTAKPHPSACNTQPNISKRRTWGREDSSTRRKTACYDFTQKNTSILNHYLPGRYLNHFTFFSSDLQKQQPTGRKNCSMNRE